MTPLKKLALTAVIFVAFLYGLNLMIKAGKTTKEVKDATPAGQACLAADRAEILVRVRLTDSAKPKFRPCELAFVKPEADGKYLVRSTFTLPGTNGFLREHSYVANVWKTGAGKDWDGLLLSLD